MVMDWFKCTFVYDLFGKRSFAQCGEDLIAQELLKDIKVGSYLEIGAYHPKVFSNTYLFYKKGWRGVVVEPNERMARLYKESRPGDEVIEGGVTGYQGNKVAEYYVFEEGARNTFDKKTAEGYQRAGYRIQRTEMKKILRLADVWPKKVDLLSIDTEGLDKEIANDLVKIKNKPKVVIVEGEEVGKVIEKMGYRLAGKTPYSLIYKF